MVDVFYFHISKFANKFSIRVNLMLFFHLFLLLLIFFNLFQLGNPIYLGTIARIYVFYPINNLSYLFQQVAKTICNLLLLIERLISFID